MSPDSLSANLATWAIIVLLSALIVFIRASLLRRAVRQVIAIFRKTGSVAWYNSKTVEELGLAQPGFLERIGRPKDYKPQALKALLRMGIIGVFRNDRLYLHEDRLKAVLGTG